MDCRLLSYTDKTKLWMSLHVYRAAMFVVKFVAINI